MSELQEQIAPENGRSSVPVERLVSKIEPVLLHGDCRKYLFDFIEADSIDLTVTSPPYDNLRTYNNSSTWGWAEFSAIAAGLWRVTKPGGVVVWVVGDATSEFCESLSSFNQVKMFNKCGFNVLDTMVWEKPNYAPGYPTLRRYDNVFEYMFILSKGKPKTFNLICDKPKKESSKQRAKYKTTYAKQDTRVESGPTANGKDFCRRTNLWSIPNGQQRGLNHPAPFPEQLAHDHIISWSNPGDVVLDCFAGSGTTGIMAYEAGRKCILIEIDETYCDIIKERFSKRFNKEIHTCL